MRGAVLCAVLCGLLLFTVEGSAAESGQAQAPDGQWLFYRCEGGLSAYRYWELTVCEDRSATFRMEYLSEPVELSLRLSEGEMTYLAELTAPLRGLNGASISQIATDVGRSVVRVGRGEEATMLEWVHTEQPDLRALREFVARLAAKERCRLLLASEKPEVIYDATHEVLSNVDRIFRPADLRNQLWEVVERWPLAGLGGLHNRSTLANAVMALGDLEPREEWAGRTMAAVSRLSREDQLFAVIALAPYIVNEYHEGTPWAELTPLLVEQLQLARATPERQRSWREKRAIVDLTAALRAIDDARAKAALQTAE
jgi:hypothetical protein